jgi:hypothetical protein
MWKILSSSPCATLSSISTFSQRDCAAARASCGWRPVGLLGYSAGTSILLAPNTAGSAVASGKPR